MNVLDTLDKLKDEWSASGAVLAVSDWARIELKKENTKLKEVLRQLEWVTAKDILKNKDESFCVFCGQDKKIGHDKDCKYYILTKEVL